MGQNVQFEQVPAGAAAVFYEYAPALYQVPALCLSYRRLKYPVGHFRGPFRLKPQAPGGGQAGSHGCGFAFFKRDQANPGNIGLELQQPVYFGKPA